MRYDSPASDSLRADFRGVLVSGWFGQRENATCCDETFVRPCQGLAALPLLVPKTTGAAQFKITDIRLIKIRLVEDVGTVPRRIGVGLAGGLQVAIGGFTVTEVHTDQGLVGIGPGIEPGALGRVQDLLVGQDPFDINRHADVLYAPQRTWGAPVEIALWDLLGKATDQPLYKLWGGLRDRILPYAALWGIGAPEERAEKAALIKAEGWRAIKLRSGFTTLRDDVRLVEEVRKAVGDDFHILTDGNKAPGDADASGENPTLWNFKRAADTAREYQRLNVYWLEEPLPRYAYDQLGSSTVSLRFPWPAARRTGGSMSSDGCSSRGVSIS